MNKRQREQCSFKAHELRIILIVGTTASVTLTHLLQEEIRWTAVSFFKLELNIETWKWVYLFIAANIRLYVFNLVKYLNTSNIMEMEIKGNPFSNSGFEWICQNFQAPLFYFFKETFLTKKLAPWTEPINMRLLDRYTEPTRNTANGNKIDNRLTQAM